MAVGCCRMFAVRRLLSAVCCLMCVGRCLLRAI